MPMFNDLSSVKNYLSSRRSGRPRDLIAPAPDRDTLRDIVAMAMRTPDHGKLAPWRVVHVAQEQRDALSDILQICYARSNPEAGRLELEAMDIFARHAPELLVVLSSPQKDSKIPIWEQQLSCGAFTMNILHAVHAHGYAAGWITGWPAFCDNVRNAFGKEGEQIAAFVFIGTPKCDLEERARPDLDSIWSDWGGA